ncbi:MAG: hypothetical protein Q8L26_00585 [Candidatus Omnitrophota bacterium]|nr:hypothetical protein [Candidatus Omnitrophota bacterium]
MSTVDNEKISYRPFVPKWLYGFVNLMEWVMRPFMSLIGHAMPVTIKKFK